MSITTVDHKKTLKHLYNPGGKDFTLVDVPEMHFLMVDGAGDPNTSAEYAAAVEALYAVSYAVRFMVKDRLAIAYTVLPLEGLWWAEDMARFSVERKGDWLWTMLIMQPDFITAALVQEAVGQTRQKKNPAALDKVRFAPYHEGLSLHIMHTGSYADEAPTLRRLHHEVMPAQGYTFNGKHHEIYLGDPRKVAPEKLKTVLRQPVRKVE